MKTSLKYSVVREEAWDDKKDKMISRVVSKGYNFCVSDTLSEEEHKRVINAFADFLEENGYRSDGFGDGSWDDAINSHDTKSFLFLSIPVKDAEDKEAIKTLYTEWKAHYKGVSNA